MTLTAQPASGYTFAGWSGGGCGTAATCTIALGTSGVSVTPSFVQTIVAKSIQVSWNPSTDSAVVGYRVYHGTASGVYAETLSTSVSSLVLKTSATGTHYFAVTSVGSSGQESTPSAEVSVAVP